MLVVRGWQVYVWRDGDSATLIDTGAPGSGDEILAAVPQIDRIVLTHGHVDHCSSAAELQDAAGATVFAGVGDVLDFGGGAEILANVGEAMLGTFRTGRRPRSVPTTVGTRCRNGLLRPR